MSQPAAPGEKYTIRRKVLKVFGAAFHVYDAEGAVIGYCEQKAFKLREDIRLFTGEDKSKELVVLKARQIIDFGATYDVTLPTGESLGSLRRKGLSSSFLRDEWRVFAADGTEVASIKETNAAMAFLRRWVDWVAIFSPQKFEVRRNADSKVLALFRQHFNPAVFRLGVSIYDDTDMQIDELVILSSACLIAAIEGRQR